MKKKRNCIFAFLTGTIVAVLFSLKLQQNCIDKWRRHADKNNGLFILMNQWTGVKQDGKNLESYFIRNDMKRIAIYGMGRVGMRLVKELQESEIEIVYGIDRNAANIYSQIEMFTLEDSLAEVDAIVVTLVDGFEDICDILSEKVSCPIIAIEDIINEV